MTEKPILISIADKELWNSWHIFDPNKFPSHLKYIVDACAEELSLIEHSLLILQREIQNDKMEFIRELHNNESFTSLH